VIDDATIKEVHFCNGTDDCALVCEVRSEDGARVCDVPNILLQQDWTISAYAYTSDYTKHCAAFKVVARSKPADYVYTETEVKTYDALEARVAQLEQGGGSFAAGGYYKPEVDGLGNLLWFPSESYMDGVEAVNIVDMVLEALPYAEERSY
jgi:hypothetical protein